jgi:LPS export ABC transporter protein LptC
MNPTRRWLTGGAWGALVAVAGLSTWLALRGHLPSVPVGTNIQTQPDYLLRQAVITRFTTTGARRYVLVAQQIVHMPQNNISILTTIGFDYFPQTATPWHLNADTGWLSRHDTHLKLAGNVKAHQVSAPDPLRFTTTEVTVLLPTERLYSKAHVTLHQGQREMQGTGLEADLKTGTLSLLKDVTSRYVP